MGVSANVQNYQNAGIPLAAVSAPFTAYLQLCGWILFGALTRLISAGFVLVMAGVLYFVHYGEPLVLGQDGSGSRFTFMMFAASLALLLAGAGPFGRSPCWVSGAC